MYSKLFIIAPQKIQTVRSGLYIIWRLIVIGPTLY